MNATLGSIQLIPAQPVMLYSSTTARCWCQDTITLRTDGQWMHRQGMYCRRQGSGLAQR